MADFNSEIVVTEDVKKLSSMQIGAIVVVVVIVLIVIFVGVWFGMTCSKKKKRHHNLSIQNRPNGIDYGGYERRQPSQMSPDDIIRMRIGTPMGPDSIPGPMSDPVSSSPVSDDQKSDTNIMVTAKEAVAMLASGKKFAVVLFSRRCPACIRLLKSVADWTKEGVLGDAKILLMESTEWMKAPDGVLKAALKTDAVPLTATFNNGAAGPKQLGAVPLDVFKQLLE